MVLHGFEILSADVQEGRLVDRASGRMPLAEIMSGHCMVA